MIPVKNLQERYGIARSRLYARMTAIGIKPNRIGKYSFIELGDLYRLDNLHNNFLSGVDPQRIKSFLHYEANRGRNESRIS